MARSGSLIAVLDKPRNVSCCAANGVGPKNGIGMALWIAGFPQGRHREGGGSGGDCGGHQATRDAGDAEQHLRHRHANNAEQAHATLGDQRRGQHDQPVNALLRTPVPLPGVAPNPVFRARQTALLSAALSFASASLEREVFSTLGL